MSVYDTSLASCMPSPRNHESKDPGFLSQQIHRPDRPMTLRSSIPRLTPDPSGLGDGTYFTQSSYFSQRLRIHVCSCLKGRIRDSHILNLAAEAAICMHGQIPVRGFQLYNFSSLRDGMLLLHDCTTYLPSIIFRPSGSPRNHQLGVIRLQDTT